VEWISEVVYTNRISKGKIKVIERKLCLFQKKKYKGSIRVEWEIVWQANILIKNAKKLWDICFLIHSKLNIEEMRT